MNNTIQYIVEFDQDEEVWYWYLEDGSHFSPEYCEHYEVLEDLRDYLDYIFLTTETNEFRKELQENLKKAKELM